MVLWYHYAPRMFVAHVQRGTTARKANCGFIAGTSAAAVAGNAFVAAITAPPKPAPLPTLVLSDEFKGRCEDSLWNCRGDFLRCTHLGYLDYRLTEAALISDLTGFYRTARPCRRRMATTANAIIPKKSAQVDGPRMALSVIESTLVDEPKSSRA